MSKYRSINGHSTLRGVLLLIAINAIAVFIVPASAQPTNETRILTIKGIVEVTSPAKSWVPATTNQLLRVGQSLRTGTNSGAAVRLSDLSILRVNEMTTVDILPARQSGGTSFLDFKSGSAYFFNRTKPMDTQFRTPMIVGAIRGTEFSVDVNAEGRTLVSLFDGEVALTNQKGELTLHKGEQAVVEPGQAPKKTAMIQAVNIIQWCLYYPAILDPAELGLNADAEKRLASSLKKYRNGDLLGALDSFPESSQFSGPEHLLRAALFMSADQIQKAEAELNQVDSDSRLAKALLSLVAAVKGHPPASIEVPATATEWMAESYRLQARSHLNEALAAARHASEKSPQFGFAWVRVAELEFSHGDMHSAKAALAKGLELSPQNAQAFALQGFLLAAEHHITAATESFNHAISLDGNLANGWLGRGLCRVRQRQWHAGIEDLQTAAALEPTRSELRSYLSKGWYETGDNPHSEKELRLAKELDPADPTPWFYSALMNQQENEINEGVRDLERAKDQNENRSIYRSRLLLDQDQSVRSANLAALYRDAGMSSVAIREASRAVNYDYANFSAHLFLAESYDTLRDPRQFNLRYETPFLSELITAQLLAPNGGSFSQTISQHEYSRLFEANHLGIFSSTEYLSRGAWAEHASQYGIVDGLSYSLDANYVTDPGQRANNDFEQLGLSATFKQQFTVADSLFVQAEYNNVKSGDVAQYYNNIGNPDFRARERQEPNVFAGWHHEWSPGVHTLLLAARLDDTLLLSDPEGRMLAFREDANGAVIASRPRNEALDYHSDLVAYSAELQQIWQFNPHTIIAGARYQTADANTKVILNQTEPLPSRPLPYTDATQSIRTDQDRIQVYGYYEWQTCDYLRLIGGLSYDRLHYPRNIDTAPITADEATRDQVSPKAGFIASLPADTFFRGSFTRSLGGVFFDNSIRLEPTQVAGFNQAFRSLIPESVIGQVPGTSFETWNLGLDHRTKFGMYLDVEGEWLNSDANRAIGSFSYTGPSFNPATLTFPSYTTEHLGYEEKSLITSVNQLLGRDWSVGAQYRLSQAELSLRNQDVPPAIAGAVRDETATLHQLSLSANFNHPSGFFAVANSVWFHQSNGGYSPALARDDFWQINAFVGYRFHRRVAELTLGLLNITDQDYHLNPLNLYNELPRSRTLAISFKFNF